MWKETHLLKTYHFVIGHKDRTGHENSYTETFLI